MSQDDLGSRPSHSVGRVCASRNGKCDTMVSVCMSLSLSLLSFFLLFFKFSSGCSFIPHHVNQGAIQKVTPQVTLYEPWSAVSAHAGSRYHRQISLCITCICACLFVSACTSFPDTTDPQLPSLSDGNFRQVVLIQQASSLCLRTPKLKLSFR